MCVHLLLDRERERECVCVYECVHMYLCVREKGGGRERVHLLLERECMCVYVYVC